MTPDEFLRRKKEENNNPKNVAKISNALVEAFVQKNNLGALKIMFYIARSNITIEEDNKITSMLIDSKNICKYCNIYIKTLKRNMNQLQESSLTFVKDEKYEQHIVVIPFIEFSYGGKIKIDMYKKILKLIKEVEKRFTVIDVQNLMQLKSKHSIRMIQLLEMINGFDEYVAKRKHYSFVQLNGMFGTNYKTMYEFERKILIPVQKELNDKSKLTFVYTIKFDKDDITAPGRPKAVGITIDLVDNT
jgi:plasmid replication initiation protein